MSTGEIPKTMRALIQKHDGYASGERAEMKPFKDLLEFGELPVPEPRQGQVLIKVKLGSVNPSDVAFVNGYYGQPRQKGHAAGFEGVGEVAVSGGGFMANRLKGKRVAFVATNAGGWAEYVVADAFGAIPLRDDIRDEDGAAMIVNPMTAHAMFDIVKKEGAKAFVMSAAGSQLCKHLAGLANEEGYRAIALVRRDDQIDSLKKLGAAHVLNVTAGDFGKRFADVLKQEKPRIFLDAVTGPLGSKVFEAMGKGARWIVYGRLDVSDTVIHEPGQLIFQSKKIEGFWLTKWFRDASIPKQLLTVRAVQKRFAEGGWSTDVTDRLSLEDAIGGLEKALAVPNGKVFITPGA
jgi:NADPH:quinone reductase-like Zn-dependent oxidoreductase